MSMFPVWLIGLFGSPPFPGCVSPADTVARIWLLGSVTMSSAEFSRTLPLSALTRPNGTVCGEASTTSVLPLWMSRMSLPTPTRWIKAFEPATPLPSAPVSVVVRRTLPLRARASSRSIGAAIATGPGVSVM